MDPFTFTEVQAVDKTHVFSGTWIIVYQARRVPPHLLLVSNGMCYSLNITGPIPDDPLDKLWVLIERKQIAVAFIEVNIPETISANFPAESMRLALKNYPRVEVNRYSCLHPIRDVLSEIFGPKLMQAQFIFEVFPILDKMGALGRVEVINMAEELRAGHYVPPIYGTEEVAEETRRARLGVNET
jgi:hypothetical protein